MLRILANDGMDKTAVDYLTGLGHEVVTDHFAGADLDKAVTEFDALIVRSATKVREPLIDIAAEAGKLKLVVRAGVGIDNIDHKYAEERALLYAIHQRLQVHQSQSLQLLICLLFPALSMFLM